MNNEQEKFKEAIKFYFDAKIPCHISLAGGKWLNGIVIYIGERGFGLQEEVFGELFVFYERVEDIEEREYRGRAE